MILLLGAMFLFVPAGQAQPVPGYDNAQVFPWAQVVTKHCFYFDIARIRPYPPGVPVTISVKASPFTGWHGHNVIDRPVPIFLSGTFANIVFATTDATGCASSGPVQMPNIAGYYIFEGYAASTARVAGINVYAKTTSVDASQPRPVPTLGSPDNLQSLIDLPYNPLTMQPYVIHPDIEHSDRTRALLGPLMVAKFQLIANNYVTFQALDGSFPRLDQADYIRGSLPDGGIADNMYGESPEWKTRKCETHDKGLEMDISNPLKYISDPILAGGYWNYLVEAIEAQPANCRMGAYKQDGTVPFEGSTQYWSTQQYVHVTCAPRSTCSNQ